MKADDNIFSQAENVPEEIVAKCIINEDKELFLEIAKSFHLISDEKTEVRPSLYRVLSLILSTAAARASFHEIRDGFAEALIEHTAREIDVLAFFRAVVLVKELDDYNLGFLDVPNDVLIGVFNDEWKKEFKKEISSLGKLTFEELICFIAERASSLSSDWALPLISYAYREKILPRAAIFSLMAGNIFLPFHEKNNEATPMTLFGSGRPDWCNNNCEHCDCADRCRG